MNFFNLEEYNLILIRYPGEVWLKSQKVKMRMLRFLIDNIKNMLGHSEIPFHKYQLSEDSSRVFFFFNNDFIPRAMEVLQKVFGIYSISPAMRTSDNMKNIVERSIEIAKKVLQENDTFAIRVKRSGKQEYTSHDIAVKVGTAILNNFQHLKLKVDLTNPKKRIFIEIRGNFSYIFTDIIKSKWEGLPIEYDKKILVMDVGRLNDLLAGFLLMKRGANIHPLLFNITNDEKFLEIRLKNWKHIMPYLPFSKFMVIHVDLTKILDRVSRELKEKRYFCAICRLIRYESFSIILKELNAEEIKGTKAITDGVNLEGMNFCDDRVDLESIALNHLFSQCPIFTPLIGFSSNKIKKLLLKISTSFKNHDYCQYKPKNQEIESNELKEIYTNLKIKELLRECLKNIQKHEIFQ